MDADFLYWRAQDLRPTKSTYCEVSSVIAATTWFQGSCSGSTLMTRMGPLPVGRHRSYISSIRVTWRELPSTAIQDISSRAKLTASNSSPQAKDFLRLTIVSICFSRHASNSSQTGFNDDLACQSGDSVYLKRQFWNSPARFGNHVQELLPRAGPASRFPTLAKS